MEGCAGALPNTLRVALASAKAFHYLERDNIAKAVFAGRQAQVGADLVEDYRHSPDGVRVVAAVFEQGVWHLGLSPVGAIPFLSRNADFAAMRLGRIFLVSSVGLHFRVKPLLGGPRAATDHA